MAVEVILYRYAQIDGGIHRTTGKSVQNSNVIINIIITALRKITAVVSSIT